MMNYLRSQKASEAYNNFLSKEPSLKEILRNENTPLEIAQVNQALYT